MSNGTCLTSRVTKLPESLNAVYSLDELLGVGSFALVYKVRDRLNGVLYAMKVVEKAPLAARGMMHQLVREVVHLKAHAESPHIIRVHEVTELSGTLYLRMELCDRSLYDLCEVEGALEEDEAIWWLREACEGVRSLHVAGLVHRDLKPANMLIDSEGSLRICDFGWCCLEADGLSGMCGTPQYAPPEMLQTVGPIHTTKVDIYCLGASLQHFLLGRIPESAEDLPPGMSEQTSELIAELMQPDPDCRPTAEEIFHDRLDVQLSAEGPLAQLWSSGRSWLAQHLGHGAVVHDNGPFGKKRLNSEASVSLTHTSRALSVASSAAPSVVGTPQTSMSFRPSVPVPGLTPPCLFSSLGPLMLAPFPSNCRGHGLQSAPPPLRNVGVAGAPWYQI